MSLLKSLAERRRRAAAGMGTGQFGAVSDGAVGRAELSELSSARVPLSGEGSSIGLAR